MPTNKRESFIFSIMMCFVMVFWMANYNIARMTGGVSFASIHEAWAGLPLAYCFAFCCDWFIASPLAKKVAFGYIIKPETSKKLYPYIVSTCMVVPMVVIMSLFGVFENASQMPGGLSFVLGAWPVLWAQNIALNFIMALPFQLLIAGPVVRWLFRRLFPVGTVLAQPAAN